MFKKQKSLQIGPGHKAPIRGGEGGGSQNCLKNPYMIIIDFFFLLNKKKYK